MSAIAGMLNVDGRPADAGLLTRMLDRLAARGPHAQGKWIDGPVGLAHRLLHTTPESLKERQPTSDAWGECRLVWDGRMDNREELIAALSADGIALGSETDSELALQAYRKWGMECPERIMGEFAMAIWDGRSRRFFCARDPIGVKPFYYSWDGQRLVFASEVNALLADPTLGTHPHEPMIADYLLMGFRDPEATFFDGIKQLRPGHVLCLENGTLLVSRYWDVDPNRETRYPREEEYFDQFRDIFREAVRCRLRSHGPVGVLLSGGIDSTAVTAMAETIRHRHNCAPSLAAFTFLNNGFFQEERQPIQTLVETYGTTVHTICQEGKTGPMSFFEVFLATSETLHHDGFLTLPFILEPVAASGVGVLLTGFGADELSRSGERGFLEDLLRAGRFRRLRSELAAMATAYGTDGRGALITLFWDQFPAPLRRVVKTALGRQVPRWLNPSFAERTHLARWTMPTRARKFPTLCREETYRTLTAPSLALALDRMDAAASAYSMECRHPYLDRRLIEFFLSIPSEVKVKHGYRKMFAQRAMQGVIPGPLRPRENTAPCVPEMDPQREKERDAHLLQRDLFHPGALVFQYVNRDEAERIQDRYLAGEVRCRNLLWQFTNLERWLQEFFPSRAGA
jgi:asparagine synthase (glutamine-hydrolysing)